MLINRLFQFSTFLITISIGFAQTSPANVGSSYLWLKADVGVTGTTNVTGWNDQSGNNRNMTSSGTNTPQLRLADANFNPMIRFDGSNDFMLRTGGILGATTHQHFYVYAAARTRSLLQRVPIFNERTGNTGSTNFMVNIPEFSGPVTFDAGNATTGRVTAPWTGTLNTNDYYVWSFQTSTGTSTPSGTRKAIYMNGALIGSNNNNLAVIGNNSSFYLGSDNGTTNFYNANTAELFIMNSPPTLTQHKMIESYLALKYGATLDQTTPYSYLSSNGTNLMWDATFAGGYNNDIAGIGRDDGYPLLQKQSKSNNGDDILTIGLESIAASNALNPGTFPTNLSFMTWGNNNDNNGIIEEVTSELPGNITSRIDREWKICEYGSVGYSSLQFNLSAVPLTQSNNARIYLMVDSDGDGNFTTGTIKYYPANSLASNILTFNDIDFKHGEVFTVGIYNGCTPGGATVVPTAWYRANNLVTSVASAVNKWSSSSPGPDLATIGGSPTIQASSIDYMPSIYFDGNDFIYQKNIETPTLLSTQTNSIFTVANVNSGSVIAKWENNGNNDKFGFEASGTTTRLNYVQNGVLGTKNIVNNPTLCAGIITSGTDSLLINGTLEATFSENILQNRVSGDLSIGASVGSTLGANPLVGAISEVIIFNKSLNFVDRQKVQSYLALKYGITLGDNSSPVSYLNSSNQTIWLASNTYQNDIIGIGQDNASCFSKSKTKGVNSDSRVIIQNPSALSNGTFFIIGNDNAALTEQTTEIPKELYKRISREWKVDMTGDLGTITLKFDISGLGLSSDINNFHLLRDTDGNFSNASIIHQNRTRVGDTLIFSNVDFNDGDYFTFSTTPISPGGNGYENMLWLKANGEVTTAGADVATWFDATPYNQDFSETFSATRPDFNTNGINFNESIEYKTNTDVLGRSLYTSIPVTFGFSMFSATKANTRINKALFNYQRNSPSNFNDFHLMDDNRFWISNINNGIGASRVLAGGLPQINEGTWTQASGALRTYLNGTQISVITATTTAIPTGGTAIIGQEQDGAGLAFSPSNAFIGHYGELIIYDKTITNTQRRKVETYLAVKYSAMLGDTLAPVNYVDTDNNIIWTGSNVYQNDVAGIGRDDIEALNQLQSFADGTEDIITIGLNSIANTNKLNSNSFPTDKSYFIWGNDNRRMDSDGVTDFGITKNGVDIKTRLRRVWKSQESGTVGTLKIRVNLASIAGRSGNGSNNLQNLRLLVDPDGIFASGALSIAPTFFDNTTDIAEFDHNFNPTDGFFFTFGSTDLGPTPLPVNIVKFDANEVNNTIEVYWETINEYNVEKYIVERSFNNLTWSAVSEVKSINNSGLINYTIFDNKNNHEGISYYRLKEKSKDGSVKVVAVDALDAHLHEGVFANIYPNPNNGEFILHIENRDQISMDIEIYDKEGKIVEKLTIAEEKNQIKAHLLQPGLYTVKIMHPKADIIEKLMIQP